MQEKNLNNKQADLDLLSQLTRIQATCGQEEELNEFILNYLHTHQHRFAAKPHIFTGFGLMNAIVLVFGKPNVAVFAHMDSVGYTVRYDNKLIPIGSPVSKHETPLKGKCNGKWVSMKLVADPMEELLCVDYQQPIEPGTVLTFDSPFTFTESHITSCYLDNRIGVYLALKLAETTENGIIAFTCCEEHGGGSVPKVARFINMNYGVSQALVADVTWASEAVFVGNGPVVSLRDYRIPRKSYTDRIRKILESKSISYQVEVEGEGSSDGAELQSSVYGFDWCFVGLPVNNMHSANETAAISDLLALQTVYRALINEL
jgi:putative aminopeptidase FrvX